MRLSQFASKANLIIPTALLEVDDINYQIVDYSKLSGLKPLVEVINPEKSWETGCTLTPWGNKGHYVALSIFQGSRHYPLITILVQGSISDACKVYETCAHYIENIVWH